MPPGKQDGDAAGHELLRVGVAEGPEHQPVALSIPLPARRGSSRRFPKKGIRFPIFSEMHRKTTKRVMSDEHLTETPISERRIIHLPRPPGATAKNQQLQNLPIPLHVSCATRSKGVISVVKPPENLRIVVSAFLGCIFSDGGRYATKHGRIDAHWERKGGSTRNEPLP